MTTPAALQPNPQPPIGDEQPHPALLLVAGHARLLGYTTYPERLGHAMTTAPADVAAWITAGLRHATAAALIDLGNTCAGAPDLLYTAGLISIPGAADRYIAGTAVRFATTCDTLASTGLVRYQPATEHPHLPAAGTRRATRRRQR
ncbi:hypothetical protein AB0H43_13635 [Hamadaea sp. NPDC050747]|uniref:hypothetical protein n=1 Tax=Hamadaea sp. NPDC050747 TaxID=3155789 RepID=UPI0033E77453